MKKGTAPVAINYRCRICSRVNGKNRIRSCPSTTSIRTATSMPKPEIVQPRRHQVETSPCSPTTIMRHPNFALGFDDIRAGMDPFTMSMIVFGLMSAAGCSARLPPMLQHQQRSLIADFEFSNPLGASKTARGHTQGAVQTNPGLWISARSARPEMLDRLLEPVGKYPTARRAAAYQLLRQLSKEDHAMLTIGSMSSSGVKTMTAREGEAHIGDSVPPTARR